MSALTIFQQGQVPAHIAKAAEELGGNIADRQTVDSLSPEGKTWTISVGGKKTKLQRKNADGDLEPLGIMKVVVLDYNEQRGRAYYEGEYDPTKVSAPLCWSDDGVAPDETVPAHVSDTLPVKPDRCANCPMSVKGSKVTPQGKLVSACSQHRMLAVVPEFAMDMSPLRLKIAMTSDWDKNSPDAEAEGWLAFKNYVESLKAGGAPHTALVVTKMKFDPQAAFPKIFFSADRWLNEAEVVKLAPVAKGDVVKQLLGGTYTPAGVDGVRKDAPAAQPEPEDDDDGQVILSDEEVVTPAAEDEVVAIAEPEEDDEVTKLKKALAAAEAKANAPVQKPAQEEVVIVPTEQVKEPKKAAKKAEAAVEPVSTDVPANVEDLLAQWTN